MKTILAPSVLSANLTNLKNDIDETISSGAEYIHFDVMDGMFVPNISFGIPVLESISKNTNALVDTHLMIDKPERYILDFSEKGSSIITFHIEATSDALGCAKMIRSLGKKAGISIKPKTSPEVLFSLIDTDAVDMILVMSVEPGFGGQSFIEDSLDKISIIKDYIEKNNKEIDIEVDGGINKDNVKSVLDAGANIIVAGSSIFKGNIKENTTEMLKAMGL